MMQLLIVDDSDLIRASLTRLMERIQGVGAIHTANTLAQAMQSVQRMAPALLILDLHLPDGNALQMIPTLKRLAPSMLIAILTNDANEFNRDKCLSAGAHWFFDKSSEFQNLIDTIQTRVAPHFRTEP